VDPYPRGPDWMPITPKTGSLFHADSHRSCLDPVGAQRIVKRREAQTPIGAISVPTLIVGVPQRQGPTSRMNICLCVNSARGTCHNGREERRPHSTLSSGVLSP